MSSFGANLKREREAQGVSLQEISDRTKIGVRLLKAIEEEHLDQLPGGIFVKSFVRQYARYLKLDEEQAVSEYLQAVGAATEAAGGAHNLRQDEKNPSSTPFSITSPDVISDSPRSSGYPRVILTAVALGVAVAGLLYGIRLFTERHASPGGAPVSAAPQSSPSGTSPETPAPSSDSGFPGSVTDPNSPLSADPNSLPRPEGPAANSAPVPGSGSQDNRAATAANPAGNAANSNATGSAPKTAPGAAATGLEKPRADAGSPNAAGGLVLEIGARKDCWVSISADGQKLFQGTLKAEAVRRAQARDSFQLTLGDAGAVTLTLNGKQLPPVGRPGEVKTLTVSSKGLPPAEPPTEP